MRVRERRTRTRTKTAFTLIETALAVVIIGTGVLAIVGAQQAYQQHNLWSQQVGTALLLANEVRELTLALPTDDPIMGSTIWGPEANEPDYLSYDDVDDFDGVAGTGVLFSPPIAATRTAIPNMTQWSQAVTVESVHESYISGPAVADGASDVVRVTCRVLYQSPQGTSPVEITRLTWVKAGN